MCQLIPAPQGQPTHKPKPCLSKTESNSGFTLVELSIVLVVIGLLIGGVLAGKSMIESAKASRVIGEINSYSIAIGSFKDLYGSYPGDCPNCGSLFGSACRAAINQNTCSGNGNGIIDGVPYTAIESSRVFEHLFLANFLTTQYAPIDDYRTTPNRVTPRSSISDVDDKVTGANNRSVGYVVKHYSTFPPAGAYGGSPETNPGHYFLLSRDNIDSEGSITPQFALSIDSKIDDGTPAKGSVRGYNPSSQCIAAYSYIPCVANNSNRYSNTSTNKTCNIYVKLVNDF